MNTVVTVARASCALPLMLALGSVAADVPESASPLGLEQRVACQRAIEEVYWRHRIWPAGSPGAKPPLDALLSSEQLEARVRDALRKSAALDVYWHRPITAAQLEAEVRRLASRTRAPETLRELWAALGDDPNLVAECLARPLVADRLIRNWYAFDERFHGPLRSRAEADLRRHGTADRMRLMSGRYDEQVWRRATPTDGAIVRRGPSAEATLGDEEWADAMAGEIGALPLSTLSPLREDDHRFEVTAVLEREPDRLRLATVTWDKVPFEQWWSAARSTVSASTDVVARGSELPAIAEAGCSDDTWSPMRHLPSARDNHIAVWTGSEMIIWGGAFCAGDEIPGGRYDPATDSWITISTSDAPAGRYGATGVWTGTELIVWGGGWCGASGSGGVENTGGRYNPTTDGWTSTSTTGAVPSARIDHTAVWSGSEMIVWGGTSSYGWCPGTGESCTDTGARYDPNSDSWTPIAVVGAPIGRRAHTAIWTGTEMIVWGGERAGQRLNDGARYDPASDDWTPTSTGGAPEGRVEHTAVWTGDEMIVWGGCRGACTYPELDSGGRYDPSADAWTPTALTGAPYQRHDHTAVWTGTEMIVWGGCVDNECSDLRSSGGRYDPVTDTWAPTAATGAPMARAQHTAVWTGREMVVWGGCYGGECVLETADGGRYDPASDSWVPTSGETSPGRRTHHTAVWTGSELIVFGGQSAQEYGDGKRYDPATDHWTSLYKYGPKRRAWHVAVWTGSEMIVWGGTVYMQGASSTGDRYDPQTDSWTPTSVTSAPSGRTGHAAVWTGTEMIVWGGVSGPVVDTGGRYDPAADTWTPMTTVNVPSARLDPTAVWTGDEMIVWGGRSEFAPHNSSGLATGGRYDPAADSWRATSATNVPSARLFHTAVWTGSEMIVWGGEDAGVVLGDGARYRPATDGWTPLAAAHAPDRRTGHTAVWTGSEMVVWGGDDDGAMRTGGRYDPAADAWRPTSTGGFAPAARTGHTATWGGSQMFVFGATSTKTEPGAAYCAGVVAGYPGASGGLRIDKTTGAALDLSWNPSCSAGATDYAVYEGALGTWYSHVPVRCTTSGNTSATVTPGGGDRYFLAVPINASYEGSHGTDSSGLERPAPTAACRAIRETTPCP